MILDQIDNAGMYGGLGERIAVGLALLSEESVLNAPLGRHEVQGSDLYYVVMDYDTKPLEQARPEVHHIYMDIQCLLKGSEVIGYTPLDGLKIETPYDGEKDIAFYHAPAALSKAILEPGMFAIFWPNEPHAPCICIDTPRPVRKLVIKIRLE